MPIKAIRIALWLLIAAFGGFLYFNLGHKDEPLISQSELGAPFALTNQRGEGVTFETLKKPYILFFGFTHCPDVCPTSLFEITQALEKMGADGANLSAYFVTVDPERDSQELLSKYLSSFSPRIQGLTGAREEIDKALRGYRVYAKKIPNENGYTYDHTAISYLFDKQGRLAGTLDYQENLETVVTKLKLLSKR